MIVKTILRQKVAVSRVHYRDAQSYFAILLDDNNRKSICRLYFGSKKQIGLFDEQKKEVKFELTTLDDYFTKLCMLELSYNSVLTLYKNDKL